MKIMRYLLGAVMALSIVGCEPIEDETKSYPELESLVGTLWFSYDETNKIFYDITYGEDDRGEMKGYADQERTELVVDRPFSYTFTPATDDINAIVRVDFEDGQHYGGALMPKGYIQVNYIDVYFIQLYEVYENGEVIKDAEGNFTSVIQMWRE
jgi:hypothetical protein